MFRFPPLIPFCTPFLTPILTGATLFLAFSAFSSGLATPRLAFAAPAEDTTALQAGPQISGFPALSPGFEEKFLVNTTRRFSGRIAFSTQIEDYWRILLLDLDSLRIRRIIDGPGNNNYPAWSPDGTMLAFVSDRDGNREIYLSDWRGMNQRRLTNNKVADDSPWWSPDGKKLAFSQGSKPGADDGDSNIAIIDIETGKITRLTTFKGRNSVPRWGPGEDEITYSTNRFWPGWDVCKWHINEKRESCLLTGTKTYCRAVWSPKGDRLVYSEGSFDQINLGALEVATGKRTTIASLEGKNYDAVFSAEGNLVAFVSENGANDHYSLFVTSGVGRPTQLIKAPYSIRYISWTSARTIDLESSRILQEEAALLKQMEEEKKAKAQAEAAALAATQEQEVSQDETFGLPRSDSPADIDSPGSPGLELDAPMPTEIPAGVPAVGDPAESD